MKFWISFYIPTPETMIPMQAVLRTDWKYLTTANPYVIIQWVLLEVSSEGEARDRIVAHYGPNVLWRSGGEVPSNFVPPRHEDLA